MSELIMLIYGSSATDLFSKADLVPLLNQSREKNRSLNITGLLLYHDGNFLQALEGERESVEALYASITRDPRHRSVLTFLKRPIPAREFSDWAMGFVDLGTVDTSQLSGYSRYLDPSFDSQAFQQDGFASTFLSVFKQIVR